MDYSDKVRRDGRKRLKALLPSARKMAKARLCEEGVDAKTSLMADSMLIHAKPANMEGLMVYRTERGWYADLVLRNTPIGLSNVLGTPVEHPHMTREAAEKDARSVLVMTLMGWMRAKEQSRTGPGEDLRVFKLHGREFSVPGDIVDAAARAWADLGEDVLGGQAEARERLDMNLAAIMGGPGFDDGKWSSASDDDRMKCLANMTTLLVFGEPFHPERRFPEVIDDLKIN